MNKVRLMVATIAVASIVLVGQQPSSIRYDVAQKPAGSPAAKPAPRPVPRPISSPACVAWGAKGKWWNPFPTQPNTGIKYAKEHKEVRPPVPPLPRPPKLIAAAWGVKKEM
jgi:hypothetical protein